MVKLITIKGLKTIYLLCLGLLISCAQSTQNPKQVKIGLSVDKEVQSVFKNKGRLFVHITSVAERAPRFQSGTMNHSVVFAKNIDAWAAENLTSMVLDESWNATSLDNYNKIIKGDHFIQAVWDQSGTSESRVNVPGNVYSEPLKIKTGSSEQIALSLSHTISNRAVVDHKLVKEFTLKSDVLSKWWDREISLKASILLPANYDENTNKRYPVRYNVAGYGGRYTRVNRLINNEEFMDWYTGEDAPEIITIFLDGEGPFGDSYQLDSENNGPYGEALINELIPQIEKSYRTFGNTANRFVDGCSTGGWVSLALQLIYPDEFNGCFSYSPDPVSFEKMQLVNVYKDDNAFYNSEGYLRPSKRDIYGEPSFSIKQEIYSENTVGSSNTFVTSGQQWGAWNAVYSPKGADGLPKAIFHPTTGKVDKEVAKYWKKYDLLDYTKTNWSTLGPKVQGKIYVWMGDMDNYYLNTSMRDFDAYLQSTSNPKSDAIIEFTPMKGHCSNYSHRIVLEAIQKKLTK